MIWTVQYGHWRLALLFCWDSYWDIRFFRGVACGYDFITRQITEARYLGFNLGPVDLYIDYDGGTE